MFIPKSVLAIFVGTFFISLFAVFSEGGEICEYNGQENCPKYNALPFILIKVSKALDHHEGTVVGLGTGFVALFTLLLWLSTRKLWESTDQSIKLARDEFHYVHRPRITLRREQVRFNPKDNGILFVLANTGALIATGLMGQFNIEVVPKGKTEEFTKEALPPYGNTMIDIGALINRPPRNHPDLEAGQRAFIYVPSGSITNESMVDVKFGNSVLYFFGFVNFQGPDDISRDSAFFRTYDPETEQFVPSDDPDYERN